MAFNCSPTSNRSKFKYEFSWLIFLNDILPITRRKIKIFSFSALPFKELHNMYLSFLQLRCQFLFESAAGSQSIVFERFLNILFDNIDRGIIIESIASNFETMFVYRDGETPNVGDEIYLYNRNEIIPIDGTQEYLFRKSEVELSVDFIVKIPSAIFPVINLEQVKAIVNQYKSIGTTFRIEQY